MIASYFTLFLEISVTRFPFVIVAKFCLSLHYVLRTPAFLQI